MFYFMKVLLGEDLLVGYFFSYVGFLFRDIDWVIKVD